MPLRSVKAARKHLVAIGWLRTFHTSQSLCNRWGTYTLINLSWTRATMGQAAEDHAATPPLESSPPPALCTTELPPPIKEDIEPLQELEHQQPAPQAEAALSGALFQPEDPPPWRKNWC